MTSVLRLRFTGPVLVLSLLAAGLGGYLFYMEALHQPGLTGSAHEHLYFRVDVLGDRVDFSRRQFQLRSGKVHFEGGNGEILHLHARNIELGYTLETLGFGLSSNCLTYGRQAFCSNSTHVLEVWVDGERLDRAAHYELDQDDNVIVWYGSRNATVPRGFMNKILPPAYTREIPGVLV